MEQIMLRVPKRLKEVFRAAAQKKGVSLNAQILQVMWASFEEMLAEIEASQEGRT